MESRRVLTQPSTVTVVPAATSPPSSFFIGVEAIWIRLIWSEKAPNNNARWRVRQPFFNYVE